MSLVLVPVSPDDPNLMTMMTARGAPRWARLAACLALEGRRVLLIRDGHPVDDDCARCGPRRRWILRALHRIPGSEARCLLTCTGCGLDVEDRLLTALCAAAGIPPPDLTGML
jgi:hypothetical protein